MRSTTSRRVWLLWIGPICAAPTVRNRLISHSPKAGESLGAGALHVIGELCRAERATLKEIADRIGPDLCLFISGMRAVRLGLAGRAVAELTGARIVPPARLVVGHAVKDLVADVGMLQADAEELHEIFGRHPDRKPTYVERHRADISDPEAGHDHAMLVGVERTKPLAEHLADAIAAVRTHRHVCADLALARIEADRVVGRGKDHAFDTRLTGCLEQIVAADDVGLQDLVP